MCVGFYEATIFSLQFLCVVYITAWCNHNVISCVVRKGQIGHWRDSGGRTSKRRKLIVGYFHEEVSPTYFCKVILAPGLDLLPIPRAFRLHLGRIPTEIVDYTGSAAIDKVGNTCHLSQDQDQAILDLQGLEV